MLLLFAHGLTAARGGARDCVAGSPDTPDGLVEALDRAGRDWHDGEPPSSYDWCGLYRAVPGLPLTLLSIRRSGFRWETPDGQPFADVRVEIGVGPSRG